MLNELALKLLSGALIILATSCTDNFEIRVDNSGNILRFYDGDIISRRSFAPCLSDLIMYDDSQPQLVVWQLKARHGCTKVESVIVGEASAGFVEIVRLDPTPGMRVYAEAREVASVQPGRWGRSGLWRLK